MADSTDNEEFIDIDPDLDRMLDVKIQLTVELGRRRPKWPKSSIWGTQSSSFLSPLMSPSIFESTTNWSRAVKRW